MADARLYVSRRRRLRPRACTIWGGCRAETERPNLRGGFGPKNAIKRNLRGRRAAPVDCIKRRVPGRGGGASFFSRTFFERSRKEASTTKTKKAFTRAANRRGACTTKKREEWLWRRLSCYAASRASFVLLKDAKGSRAKNLRSDALTFLTKRKRRQRRSHVQSHVYSHTYRHTYHPTNALSRCALHHREPSSPRAFEPSSVVVVSRGARRIFFFPRRPVFRVFRVVSDPTQIDRRFGSRARDLRGEHVRDCLLARVYLRLDPLDGGGGVGLEPRGARGRVADARA